MVYLTRGELNQVVMTLTEKVDTTFSPVRFMLQLKSNQSLNTFRAVIADVSENPSRYNEFSISETEDPNPLLGEFELPQGGDYQYTAYQVNANSILDEAIVKTLEVGICRVIETERPTKVKYTPPTTTKVYNG